MSYHTKMLTHYYALHFIWQGKPPTSFSVSQGNLTSRLFFHMQTPSFGSGPPPFAHRRPSRAPRPRRVGATSYTDPPDAVPDPPRRRRPPWAPSSQQPGATGSTDPPDVAPDHTRRQWPPWAPSSSAARGHRQYRPAGRSTGSTPPAVATLGAKLVGGPGPPAVPTRRTSHRITPAGSGHPGRRARRRPGATSSTDPPDAVPDPPRRQWPPWAPSSSAARGHRQYRPAGRRTGSPPPAVATLGAELVGGPGPPATPAAVSATGA